MPPTDDEIREMAKARVSLRWNAAAYAIVNLFLVALWWFTGTGSGLGGGGAYFWPIWPIMGWGLGLAFHAWAAYGRRLDAVEREETKLRETLGRR